MNSSNLSNKKSGLLEEVSTEYYLLANSHIFLSEFEGKEIVKLEKEGLSVLSYAAIRDSAFMLRTNHISQIAKILDDPAASDNDKYVALTILRNAEISAKGVLPFCQDTGTAIINGFKGEQIWTGFDDAEALSTGVCNAYTRENLRYSQVLPVDMYKEVNSGNNLPVQIDIQAVQGNEYNFLFVAKGGGSANKTVLFQETKAILSHEKLERFLIEKLKLLGTSACPPYHASFVIGGTSAEECLKTVKFATAKYLDNLPNKGNHSGQPFRDKQLEEKILKASYNIGYGAQFGGKHFVLDVRVIRLPRHGASCPIGMGVSCIADRNVKAKINKEGIWLEKLENNPGRFIPVKYRNDYEGAIEIDLNKPIKDVLSILTKYPVGTRLHLNGILIVARDIAHSRLKEKLDGGEKLPEYMKDHPVFYAGPAKTPTGKASGSLGPTTAGRMDSYVDLFQQNGGSLITIAKGNRNKVVVNACKKYGGFYLGSIGGPAALLAEKNIKKVELLEFHDLGMEAIYKVEVVNFPVFILIDDKGNDFYKIIDEQYKL